MPAEATLVLACFIACVSFYGLLRILDWVFSPLDQPDHDDFPDDDKDPNFATDKDRWPDGDAP